MTKYPIVRVFTYKDGLLSRFAHDLQLAVTEFDLTLTDGKLEGRLDTGSLVVEGAVRDGKLDHRVLSSSDCQKILRTAAKDVLRSDRFPEAELEVAVRSTDDGVHLDGTLTLLGRRLALPRILPVHLGTAWICEFHLTPSRWGVRPYRAMGGALKVQDRIRIEVALPVEEEWEHDGGTYRWAMGPSGAISEAGGSIAEE